jgi:glucokinase
LPIPDTPMGLVADIGGTNARFALAARVDGRPELFGLESFYCRDFHSAEEAVTAYLKGHERARPTSAVLAVAGPVINGEISFTNTDWTISERKFRDTMNLASAKLVNDYAALALAAPLLETTDTILIGPEHDTRAVGNILILGAGTGFGVSALVRSESVEAVLTTEGGHTSFAPTNELEVRIWRILNQQFGRVSIERILSGPGLLSLHDALCQIEGKTSDCRKPADVTRASQAGDATAEHTLQVFCEIMGSVAGDFALAYGSEGGVYLAGGVNKHLAEVLRTSNFRERFEDKGRFRSYTRRISTRLIINTHTVALIGAARTLQHMPGIAA